MNLTVDYVGDSFLDKILGFEYGNRVDVSKRPIQSSKVNPYDGTTKVDEDDVDTHDDGSQVTILHEVGHQLGLNHPGAYCGESENSYWDYRSDYNGLPGRHNLMGKGIVLHKDDFDRAFCNHIDSAR